MPKGVIYAAMILLILAMIPPAVIARSRTVPSTQRRIHLIQDMDNQGKFKAQSVNPGFVDLRAMRPLVPGTIARGELLADDHYERGYVIGNGSDGQPATRWFDTFPRQITVNEGLLKRGQDRFGIYCSVCHGLAGYGDGIVNNRGLMLVEAGTNGTAWVQAKSLHEDLIRVQPPGQIFNTITHGIRNMAGYEAQIPVADRWAIVAYVKALQRSQHALPDDLPAGERANLRDIDATDTAFGGTP